MVEIIAAACAGFLAGWLVGRLDRDTQDDWRRRFNHENRRGPVGPPPLRLDPGRTIRGNGSTVAVRNNSGATIGKGVPVYVTGSSGTVLTIAPGGLEPPPAPPGYVRHFINNPVQIAECGGPCMQGPEHCDCGAMWRHVPLISYGPRLDEGRTIRGNGSGGPTTPKPEILPSGTNPPPPGAKPAPPAGPPEKPQPPLGRVVDASGRTVGTIRKPQFPHGLVIDAHGHVVGYIPLPDPQGGTPNPPPSDP